MGRQAYGKGGEDLTITVPVGTVVINVATDEVIGDLTRHGDRLLVAKGAAVAWATCTSRARPPLAAPGAAGRAG